MGWGLAVRGQARPMPAWRMGAYQRQVRVDPGGDLHNHAHVSANGEARTIKCKQCTITTICCIDYEICSSANHTTPHPHHWQPSTKLSLAANIEPNRRIRSAQMRPTCSRACSRARRRLTSRCYDTMRNRFVVRVGKKGRVATWHTL